MLEDAYVLINEKKISNVKELVPVLEAVVNAGKPLLIVAEEVDGEALATLVINKLRGTLQGGRRQGPRLRRSPQGDAGRHRHPHRRQRRCSKASARSWRAPTLADLGRAKKIVVDKDNTTIIEAPARAPKSRAASSSCAARSKTPPATTIARSWKSGWPSWPAAWPR